jgi:hypothetical protein
MDGDPVAKPGDQRTGLLIVAVAFVAALCLSFWARNVASPTAPDLAPPTTDGLVGFPRQVDVIASLEGASAVSMRTELRGIAISGVASDGTVDMTLPGARVRFVFTSPKGEGPQPERPPGTLPRRAFCGKQTVQVKEAGLVAEPDVAAYPCGGIRGERLPAPRCGPKEVWAHARTRGTPGELRANIEYYRSSAGPSWRFEIPGTPHTFSLYGDCGRELSSSEASGSIP